MDANANVVMQHLRREHYGPPPGHAQLRGTRHLRHPPPKQAALPPPQGQGVIYHPALFGPVAGPGRGPARPVPNLRPRPPGPRREALAFASGAGNGRPPPPRSHAHAHGQAPPSRDPFLEEQVEVLHDKMEGLEGELRYAWRALDVLSQEYVKMWQRLEKMEGLLTEQQTVIAQLIDLYSVESSDTANENGKTPSPASPPSDPRDALRLRPHPHTHPPAIPDENFYKALNAVHGEARDDDDEDDDSDGSPRNSGGGVFGVPGVFPPRRRGEAAAEGRRRAENGAPARRGGSRGESDDARSGASTASTVRSEDVGAFPVPTDLSPAGYDNLSPPPGPPPPPPKKTATEGKKKKTKKQGNGRTRVAADAPPPSAPAGRRPPAVDGDGTPFPAPSSLPLFSEPPAPPAPPAPSAPPAPPAPPALSNGTPLFPSFQTALVGGGQKEAGGRGGRSKRKPADAEDPGTTFPPDKVSRRLPFLDINVCFSPTPIRRATGDARPRDGSRTQRGSLAPLLASRVRRKRKESFGGK